MGSIKPPSNYNVVEFPRRRKSYNNLTARDRRDIIDFRSQAEAAGYRALIIHVMKADDSCGTLDFVAAYQVGEAWSTWGFARDGAVIRVWNALTLEDAGSFPNMHLALKRILVDGDQPALQSTDENLSACNVSPPQTS